MSSKNGGFAAKTTHRMLEKATEGRKTHLPTAASGTLP